MKVRYSARTDVGRTRSHNEDCYGLGSEEQARAKGHLLVVCDGMGGHAAGEVASRIAVDTILGSYYRNEDPDRASALEESFLQANAAVYTQGRGTMGTTGVAALLYDDALHVANVGDSRAYLIRDGALRQLTQDHSFVAEQVAAGLLTPDQARYSVHRNVITRALGYQPEVVVDVTRWPLRGGDIVLLSSDGLHGLVEDAEIEVLAAQNELEPLVDHLIDLANARGGSDNITVAVMSLDDLEYDQAQSGAAARAADDTLDEPSAPEATTQRLAVDVAPPPALRASTPTAAPARAARASAAELPLRLWGTLLTSATLIALLGFALWLVLDEGSGGALLQPTATLAPAVATRTTTPRPSPQATPRASPILPTPSVAPLAATPTVRP
jgi:PPM family protein phosphatase